MADDDDWPPGDIDVTRHKMPVAWSDARRFFSKHVGAFRCQMCGHDDFGVSIDPDQKYLATFRYEPAGPGTAKNSPLLAALAVCMSCGHIHTFSVATMAEWIRRNPSDEAS